MNYDQIVNHELKIGDFVRGYHGKPLDRTYYVVLDIVEGNETGYKHWYARCMCIKGRQIEGKKEITVGTMVKLRLANLKKVNVEFENDSHSKENAVQLVDVVRNGVKELETELQHLHDLMTEMDKFEKE